MRLQPGERFVTHHEPPVLILPVQEPAAFPSVAPASADPVPQTYPAGTQTYEAFLWSQINESAMVDQSNTFAAVQTVTITDTGTANEPDALLLQHRTSGVPTTSFGSVLRMQADNSANTVTDQLKIAAGWSSAAAGSENSLAIFSVLRAGVPVETLRLNPNGIAGRAQFAGDLFHFNPLGSVGFYGVGPVTRPTVTGSKGANAALTSLLTALASQGLIIDSSS